MGVFMDWNLQTDIVTCNYGFDSPLNFSGKFGIKILLQLVHAEFFVFLIIRIHFLKLGYEDNKYKDTFYVLFIDRETSVKE